MRVRSLLTALAVACGALLASAGTSQASDVPVPIVGGHNATQVYSFMVSLQDRSGSHFCGGSLIKADWVVTAGHCLDGETPSSVRVRVGTTNRTSGGTVATGAQIIIHPDSSVDLALLRLSTPVRQAPVKIASASGSVGTATRIIGWGQTCRTQGGCGAPKILQELDTSIVSDSRCSGGDIKPGSEICTNNTDGNRGACYGDSGGPQIKSVAGGWQLIGATSRSGGGSVCAKEPSIYVDVPHFRSWISQHVGSL
ncbi:secreted trypsin-like serine protease [Kibdelosporangium banguiense]|uniref:Secreted trypsin-like serine protease n=1 Tax=Kibdelosporangium banguiense TaxID=1365924 RepID=A0ABS4TUI7_9PSEU|nr:serine protease [Kibdelosporangium banguiense]MBP2328084.1 secreted trypsin-like serine protease [Kibdelosporangium banguiense]